MLTYLYKIILNRIEFITLKVIHLQKLWYILTNNKNQDVSYQNNNLKKYLNFLCLV